MTYKPTPTSEGDSQSDGWQVTDHSLLDAMLAATPAQRLARLEEALRLAYASGALRAAGISHYIAYRATEVRFAGYPYSNKETFGGRTAGSFGFAIMR